MSQTLRSAPLALRSRPVREPRSASDTANLLARLDAEWSQTCLGHDGLARSWAAETPALDGCCCLDDVVAVMSSSPAAALAVLHRARGGCPVAGRCLLRALVPLLLELVRHDPRADLGDYLGASWPVAMDTDLGPDDPDLPDGGCGRLAGSSVLPAVVTLTHRAVVRERAGLWVMATPGGVASDLPGTGTPGPDAALDAGRVIDAARSLRLVPGASADVLESVYSEGMSGAEAARRHAMSPDMVRYRCSSAVRRLRAHRHDLLDVITA